MKEDGDDLPGPAVRQRIREMDPAVFPRLHRRQHDHGPIVELSLATADDANARTAHSVGDVWMNFELDHHIAKVGCRVVHDRV